MGASVSESCKPTCNPECVRGTMQIAEDDVVATKVPMAIIFGADLDTDDDQPSRSEPEHMLMSRVLEQPAEPPPGGEPPSPCSTESPGKAALLEVTHQSAASNVLVYAGSLEDADTASDCSGSDEERRHEFEAFRQNVLARKCYSGVTVPPETHPVVDSQQRMCLSPQRR